MNIYKQSKLKELRLWIVQIGLPAILLYLYINDRPELKKDIIYKCYQLQQFCKKGMDNLKNKFKRG